jgi:hypothetical protein
MSSARSYWIKQVDAWQASGLTRKEYATTHGLNYKNFGWWIWFLEQAGHGPYPKPARPTKPKSTDAPKTKQVDPNTPQILAMWTGGIPVEVIAHDLNKTTQAVRLIAAYHKVKRPAWYLSAIRGKTNPAGVQA